MINSGFYLEVESFWRAEDWMILYRKGYLVRKIWNTFYAFIRRFNCLVKVNRFDLIFIHREVTPIGPPIFEWIISKWFGKKIIYDFDDAIWLPNTSKENAIVGWLKFHSKTSTICKLSFKVSCGNYFLRDYAMNYNSNCFYNPSTIDLNYHKVEGMVNRNKDRLVIGWTGSHSTMKYLDLVIPILKELEESHEFEFRVISNIDPNIELKTFRYVKWNKSTEIADLLDFDIGIMPLIDDIWAQGKCGFKLLQYMSLGIPSLASPVGVNTQIIENGVNGYLCSDTNDWERSIVGLLTNQTLRGKMGYAAKAKIEKYYSVKSNEKNFLSLFTE